MQDKHDYRSIIYGSYRRAGYAQKNIEGEASTRSRMENYQSEFGDLLPENRDARILDIGCGSGFLLDFLCRRGYRNISGVDTSSEQVEFARKQGINVVQADANEYLKNSKDKFDIIFMTDVVEHLGKQEVFDIFLNIRDALNVGGKFVIRTINASSIYSPTSRYIDFTHELSFTEHSLRQILYSIGFDVVHIKDNHIPFGLKPKRFLRWAGVKLLRAAQKAVFTLEVGVDRPSMYGKYLIVTAIKTAKAE